MSWDDDVLASSTRKERRKTKRSTSKKLLNPSGERESRDHVLHPRHPTHEGGNSSLKNWPRWTLRKCAQKRRKFSFSATIVYPDTCMRSRPVVEIMFPVDRKCCTFFPTPPDDSMPYRSTTLVHHLACVTFPRNFA